MDTRICPVVTRIVLRTRNKGCGAGWMPDGGKNFQSSSSGIWIVTDV